MEACILGEEMQNEITSQLGKHTSQGFALKGSCIQSRLISRIVQVIKARKPYTYTTEFLSKFYILNRILVSIS